jgi:hypothetical protein
MHINNILYVYIYQNNLYYCVVMSSNSGSESESMSSSKLVVVLDCKTFFLACLNADAKYLSIHSCVCPGITVIK